MKGLNCRSRACCTATLAGDDASNGEEVTTSVKPKSASGTTLGNLAADAPAERPSLADLRHHESFPANRPAVPVFFLSDSTGISAETMGNALLIQFPFLRFDRRLIPFINSLEEARKVVAILDAVMDGPVTPLAFTTAAVDEIRIELHRSRCPIIDFFELHMAQVESILQARGERVVSQLHGVGDIKRYTARMAAVEYAIEHDDGQSMRALDKADVILVAPSRCGKTPTTMYLALQHGIFVANYPLVEEDFSSAELPGPVRWHDNDPSTAQPSPAAKTAKLPLCITRAVHIRAAAGRGDVPESSTSRDQLLGQVRRGDVHSDLADYEPDVPRTERTSHARSLDYLDYRVVLRSQSYRSRPSGRQECIAGRDGPKPHFGGRTRTGWVCYYRGRIPRVSQPERPGRDDQCRAGVARY